MDLSELSCRFVHCCCGSVAPNRDCASVPEGWPTSSVHTVMLFVNRFTRTGSLWAMQIDPVSGHVARCKKALEIWRTQKAKTKGVHGRRTSTYNDKKDWLYVPKLCKGPTRKTSASAHFSPPCLRPLVTPHHTSRPALPVSSSCPCPLARSTTTATRRAPESKPQRSATSTMQQRPPRHQPRPAPSGSGERE